MANTKYLIIPEFKNSIVVPTGAGTTKWAKSNSEGKLEWAELSFTYERTFGLTGEAKAETLPRAYFAINSGETKKCAKVFYNIDEGTEIKAEVRKNGSAQEFEGGSKEITLVSTEVKEKKFVSAIEFANKDYIDVVLKSPSGTPKIPQITLVIEVSI
jgi:hypothetical protein